VIRDAGSLIRPRNIAVLGASANRRTQGNGVIQNLQKAGYRGPIVPIHPTAQTIDGLAVAPAIEELASGTELAVVAIPAPGVANALLRLDRAGVLAAMVFTNGFTAPEETEFRRFAQTSRMTIHGPNCMGLINLSDSIVLYPSTITEKVRPGKVALIAQSGSAAISIMNSTATGFSKVVTMGSEFQVTAPDYMRWLTTDDATRVIGIVLESVKDPADFAAATRDIHAAGKSVVVLKVGRSDVGARAVQAHTGALISHQDAYDCFFDDCGVPTVEDYDQLIATMECLAACRVSTNGCRIGIVGISGGETALACDVAADLGIPLAGFTAATNDRIKAALRGSTGQNPLDLGATVHHTTEQDADAIDAILDDPNVDALLVVQDAQATLTPTMLGNYTPRLQAYGEHGRKSSKPVVLVSPSSENAHAWIVAELEPCGVPVLRGLRSGLAAMRALGRHGRTLETLRQPDRRVCAGKGVRSSLPFQDELAASSGPVPAALTAKLLAAYHIPFVRSALVASPDEALARADEIGYPVVLKISSPDIPHRSDVGGVELGIGDRSGLGAAIDRMLGNVRAAKPNARIEGFEVQEQLIGWIEAMAGFVATPPFAPLTVVGTGGTMIELYADKAVGLSPLCARDAEAMIARTRLGALLDGYRSLIPKTDPKGLAGLVAKLSVMAIDYSAYLSECDVNPVLVRQGTGEVRAVDALLIASGRADGP
jgi:acetate---CoA ligase (ADP-forming)